MPTQVGRVIPYSTYFTPAASAADPSEPFGTGVIASTLPGEANGQYFHFNAARAGEVNLPYLSGPPDIPTNASVTSVSVVYSIADPAGSGQSTFATVHTGATTAIRDALTPGFPLVTLTTDANLTPWTTLTAYQSYYGVYCTTGAVTGSIEWNAIVFTINFTLPVPIPVTNAAQNITTQTAQLIGTVDANQAVVASPSDYPVDVYFEYGPTAAFGTSVLVGQANGNGPVVYFANISGLIPGTTYYHRIVARTTAYGNPIDNYPGGTGSFVTNTNEVVCMVF